MIVLKVGDSKACVDEVAFSPDGATIAVPGKMNGVFLWQSFTNAPQVEVVGTSGRWVTRIAFAPNGETLYVGGYHLDAVRMADRSVTPLPITSYAPLGFGVVPVNSRLVVVMGDAGHRTSRFRCWAAGEFEEPLWDFTTPGQVWAQPLFSVDGETFAICEHHDSNQGPQAHRAIRSTATGKLLDLSVALADTPDMVSRSPDDRLLAWLIRRRIMIYTMADTALVKIVKNTAAKHFTGMAWHPSGKYLATTSNDETVKLYETTKWKLVRTFTWDIGRMRSVAFSPDGTLAAAGSDKGKVVVWDVDL
jgi:hypothetical protein